MLTKFKSMQDGMEYKVHVLVLKIENATTKNGETYIRLTCTDGETDIVATMFNASSERYVKRGLSEEMVAVATLVKKGQYYNFTKLEPNTDSTITTNSFAKVAPINIEEGYQEILDAIKTVSTTTVGKVAEAIYVKHKEAIMRSSAAQGVHHNYVGGLIHHTVFMLRIAKAVCDVYTDLDKELLVCGVALHDIGKLEELETTLLGNASYTTEGFLFGHAWIGTHMIETMCRELKCEVDEKMMLLLHLLLSHHGNLEWGAVKKPACKEAYALHMIDMLDSRMKIYDNAYTETESGCMSDSAFFALDNNRVYRPSFS